LIYDTNYRTSLMGEKCFGKYHEKPIPHYFEQLLPHIDFLSAGIEDLKDMYPDRFKDFNHKHEDRLKNIEVIDGKSVEMCALFRKEGFQGHVEIKGGACGTFWQNSQGDIEHTDTPNPMDKPLDVTGGGDSNLSTKIMIMRLLGKSSLSADEIILTANKFANVMSETVVNTLGAQPAADVLAPVWHDIVDQVEQVIGSSRD